MVGQGRVGCNTDNLLSKGEITIFSMAVWWPYLLADWNPFQGDASRG